MPSSFATRPRPRPGFTLIELSVVLVVMSLLFAVILPAMQQVRRREGQDRAALRLRQIAAAMFRHHAAHGVYPDSFEPLRPVLDEDLWTAIVSDQAVDGSKYRGRAAGDGAVELFTVVNNPMRVTHRLSMMLREDDATVFAESGKFPPIASATDEQAVAEHAARMQQIMDSGMKAAMCAVDDGAAEAQLEIAAAWQDVGARQTAWNLLDQDHDGRISRSEVFGLPWDSLPILGKCPAEFSDAAQAALAFEEDEPDYVVPVTESLRWHHALLDRLHGDVGELRVADPTQPTFIPLAMSLDQVGTSLRTAQLPLAVRRVGRFEQSVGQFVLGGSVPEEFGNSLITTASLFEAALIAKLFTIPDPARPLENPVVLRVDWSAAGPGGINDPFPDVTGALAYAEEQGFAAVEVVIRPGTYRGSLAITRHTRLRGEAGINFNPLVVGRVASAGPFAVELLNLSLTSSEQVPGVISVRHPDASTYLAGVRIANALGYAIRQSGGDFRCHNLVVEGTAAHSADLGVAMQFDGGAYVELKDVRLQGNRAGGLLLAGVDTQAVVSELEISQTRANAYALDRIQDEIRNNQDYDPSVIAPGTCALDVRDGASLEGEFVSLTNNEYVGMIVHRLGTVVLSDSQITSTSQVTQVRSDQNLYGYNVAVFDQGSLEMTLFTVSHATIGFVLQGNIDVRLRGTSSTRSVVSNCDVGLALGEGLPPDFDVGELELGIEFQNNTVNVRAVSLPPPSTVMPVP